jgi:hypothetical protein
VAETGMGEEWAKIITINNNYYNYEDDDMRRDDQDEK